MVTYYHTAKYIYAVANGYCGAVFDKEYGELEEHKLLVKPVIGAVVGNDYQTLISLAEVASRLNGTCRLCFQLGAAVLHTDFVLRVEAKDSLSIPPSLRPMQSIIPDAGESMRFPDIPPLRAFRKPGD